MQTATSKVTRSFAVTLVALVAALGVAIGAAHASPSASGHPLPRTSHWTSRPTGLHWEHAGPRTWHWTGRDRSA